MIDPKYFVYRLAQQEEKSSYHFVDVDMDSGVNEYAVYYGITTDPQMRLSKHRPKCKLASSFQPPTQDLCPPSSALEIKSQANPRASVQFLVRIPQPSHQPSYTK